MPRFDRTGPWGMGPGTGWGLGPCGLGLGWRRGYGGGFRRAWTNQDEKVALEEERKILEEELKEIKKEIDSLKGQK